MYLTSFDRQHAGINDFIITEKKELRYPALSGVQCWITTWIVNDRNPKADKDALISTNTATFTG